MNEELKIIINAITGDARKELGNVSKELKGIKSSGGGAAGAMKMVGKAAGAAVAAVAAVGAALVAMGVALAKVSENTAEYRKSMAQLTSAFQANGASAEQAKKTYGELFRFMGETDTAVEASNLLSQLTTDEKELAEWTKTLQGVYATFPDSLPIEGLVESANETARVGKVTGNLADALNWAGVSEDAFNAKLAQTTTLSEREALIRETLSGLYGDAAELYEKNAASILAQNEAQNRLNESLARAGAAAQPLQTSLTNLSATLMEALAPAIEYIVPYLVMFIDAISKAVSWTVSFIKALTGSKEAAKATQQIGTSISKAVGGSQGLGKGFEDATKAAEKLKRTTAGFDELNVMSSGSSSAGSSGGGGYTSGGGGGYTSGGGIDIGSSLTDGLDSAGGKMEAFANKVKAVFNELKNKISGWAKLFTPAVTAWGGAFDSIKTSWNSVKDNFANGGINIGQSLQTLGGYLLNDFIPNTVNSISTNLAPVLGELAGFTLEEAGKSFETFGETINKATEDIILPALENFQLITDGALDGVSEAWDTHGTELLTNLSTAFDGLRETWDTFYREVIEPIAEAVNTFVKEVWEEHLKPLWDDLVEAFLDISNNLTILWNTVLKPIVDWILKKIYPPIKQVINNILAVLKTVIEFVSSIVQSAIRIIKGIVQFITGVFTGDWEKAWEGIKNIVGGIWDGIWATIKFVANLIIDGINSLWSGIYHAVKGIVDTIGDIAGVIGNLLGQDWSFSMPDSPPLIPKLAKGGIVNSATLATIGERGKEAVLPLENNTGWMDVLADRIAARQATPSKIVLALDGKELGYATINSINNITKQTGELKLVLA